MEPQTKAGLDAQGQAQTGCGPDVGPVQTVMREALSAAFRRAAVPRQTAEAIDWFDSTAPRRWKTADGVVEYDW